MKLLSKIVENEKGAIGWGILLVNRRSRTDTARAVHGTWVHIIRNFAR